MKGRSLLKSWPRFTFTCDLPYIASNSLRKIYVCTLVNYATVEKIKTIDCRVICTMHGS